MFLMKLSVRPLSLNHMWFKEENPNRSSNLSVISEVSDFPNKPDVSVSEKFDPHICPPRVGRTPGREDTGEPKNRL